jgi:hypothetical protein
MNRSVSAFAIAVSLIAAGAAACRAEEKRSECHFLRPEAVVTSERSWFAMEILRPDGDPETLLAWNGELDEERGALLVTKIDFRTGRTSDALIQHREGDPWPPRGHTAFIGEEPVREQHPFVLTGMLRYDILGRTETKDVIRLSEGQFVTVKQKRFTGTRRMMFGNRPLLEQSFVNADRSMTEVDRDVLVEPDGDRIVCKCDDGLTIKTYIALFSRKKLEAEQASISKK